MKLEPERGVLIDGGYPETAPLIIGSIAKLGFNIKDVNSGLRQMPPLSTIIIYARNVQRSATFYQRHFGFETTGEIVEGLIELAAANGGATILIHQAAKSVKLGQVGVKLSFAVKDVEAFKANAVAQGLKFGATHRANGYAFANTKDPDKNSISISSRDFRGREPE